MKRRAGFSFIEILFIIAIGALLLVVILPVFSAAKKKGHRAQCISNLRQIGMALQMYSEDNDELMPPWLNRQHDDAGKTSEFDNPRALYECLMYKTREHGIFYCGSDLYAGKEIQVFGVCHKYTSYCYNFRPPSSPEGAIMAGGVYKGGRLIVPPSYYPLVRDANSIESSETVGGQRAIGCRHLSAVNVLYLDWHVGSERVVLPEKS